MTIQVMCGNSVHFPKAATVSLFSLVGGLINPKVMTAHKRYLFPTIEVLNTKRRYLPLKLVAR